MSKLRIRCSAIGRLMTEPKTKGEILSVGAKTAIRELVAQDIFGIDFEVSGKEMEKGIRVESDGIALLNSVRGLSLEKNVERRTDEYLSGECDLFDAERRRGHDLKCSWSVATFPICELDAKNAMYEWQMRGYMRLWDADEWEVNYALVDTPEDLIRFDPVHMHIVSHLPEHMRLTTWLVKRDLEKEALMVEKIKAARAYFQEVAWEFDRTHDPEAIKAGNEVPGAHLESRKNLVIA